MSVKTRILKALQELDLGDISEDGLIAVLLDAYDTRGREIKRLEGENVHEREQLHEQRESILRERHRMRSDPTLLCVADYFFIAPDGKTKFHVLVAEGKVHLNQQLSNYAVAMRPISKEQAGW